MQPTLQWRIASVIFRNIKNHNAGQRNIFQSQKNRILSSYMCKSFHSTHQQLKKNDRVPTALRSKKSKAEKTTTQHFVDLKQVNYFCSLKNLEFSY